MAYQGVHETRASPNNPNVAFELGYALGANEPGFVVVQQDAVAQMSADITGWDQLRYSDFDDLAEKLFARITTARVPQRVVVPAQQVTSEPTEMLRQLHFGIPAVEEAVLCVYAVPVNYQRYVKDRSVFGAYPYRPEDLCTPVFAGPNTTHYETFYWPMGFNYDRPGPDFLEVYDGRSSRQSDRITNFRLYLSGAAMYMQRLREGAANTPFLYLYMFEELVEMALISIAAVRKLLTFPEDQDLAVGSVFLRAADLRISTANRQFYLPDDSGHPLIRSSDEMWLPESPVVVEGAALASEANRVAGEISADLRTKLD